MGEEGQTSTEFNKGRGEAKVGVLPEARKPVPSSTRVVIVTARTDALMEVPNGLDIE